MFLMDRADSVALIQKQISKQASKHDSRKLYRRLSLSQIRERVTDATRVQGKQRKWESGWKDQGPKVPMALPNYVTMYVSLYGEPLVIALAMAAVCQGSWVPLLRSCSASLSSLITPFHVAFRSLCIGASVETVPTRHLSICSGFD